MRTQVIKSYSISYKQVKVEVSDDIYAIEFFEDGNLVKRSWHTKKGFAKSHPGIYCPENVRFDYYDNINFLNSNTTANADNLFDEIPRPLLFNCWDDFKGLDHVVCNYLTTDGNLYQINRPDPIPIWRASDYINGFTDQKYPLDKVINILKNYDWIRNISIKTIPYFMQADLDYGIHYVYFEYKLPRSEDLVLLKKHEMFKKHYFD